jgi:apolipoprotein N-acyltransferase
MRPPVPPVVERALGSELAALVAANWELIALFPVACLFLVWLLRHETGVPAAIGALIMPPVVGVGFFVAFWIHVGLQITVLQALGVLCAALVPLLVAFDLAFTGRRSPVRQGPPSRRG